MKIKAREQRTAVLAAMLLAASAGGALAADVTNIVVEPVVTEEGSYIESWASAGVEYVWGHNTYQIGYPVSFWDGTTLDGYFPFSELEFPTEFATASVEAGVLAYDRLRLAAKYSFNISDPNGDMKDSDWITPEDPSRLDIFSLSNINEFEYYTVDVDAAWRFWQTDKGYVSGGGGYLYQHFRYGCNFVRQGSPSGLAGFDYDGDGTTGLIYTLDHSIPYLQLRAGMKVDERWEVSGRLAFSPFVNTKDKDEHKLRYKENQGDMDGYSWMLSVMGTYNLTKHWYLGGGFDFMSVDVDGTMDASFFNWYDHTVTEELESRLVTAKLNIGYKF